MESKQCQFEEGMTLEEVCKRLYYTNTQPHVQGLNVSSLLPVHKSSNL